jgi:F-type H+-transporting ATPase subunit alpha
VNAGLSVSRVGGAAQTNIIRKLVGGVRIAQAQYRELAAFAQFASDLDEATRKQLERGQRVAEMLKQKQYSPLSVAEEAVCLLIADQGYLDDIELKKVSEFEHELLGFLHDKYKKLLDEINKKPVYSDENISKLKAAVEEFKKTFVS